MARSSARDDRGQEPGEDRGALRRPSDDRLPLAPSLSPRPRQRQAPKLKRDRRADETFILEFFKGRWSDLTRKARKRGGTARHPGLHQDNIPILVARDRKGATFDAVLPQVDSATVGAALAGVVTRDNHLIGDGGRAIAAFARRAGITPLHAVPAPGKTDPRGASPAHQQRQRLPRPPQAVAQPLQRRRHQEPAQLSRLAARPRSLGRPTRPANLDQRRYRKRPIPTANAIRAKRYRELCRREWAAWRCGGRRLGQADFCGEGGEVCRYCGRQCFVFPALERVFANRVKLLA